MFIVVTYDISDDRCRTRVYKALRRFGDPVQYSVFECILDESRLADMRTAVSDAVTGFHATVRYYELCEPCRKGTITLGAAFTTSLKREYIV